MGVGISLSKGSCWLSAGWVGRAAADYIIPQLQGNTASAVKARLDDMCLYPGAIAFFDEVGPEELQTLFAATELGLAQARADGPAGWHDPTAHPFFLRHFEDLVKYLRSDPRLSGGSAADKL